MENFQIYNRFDNKSASNSILILPQHSHILIFFCFFWGGGEGFKIALGLYISPKENIFTAVFLQWILQHLGPRPGNGVEK